MRYTTLLEGLVLFSILTAPACVDMTPADEAELETMEDALLALDADARNDENAPFHEGTGAKANRRARPVLRQQNLSSSSRRAPQLLAANAEIADIPDDGDASAVSGSGDSRVPPPPPPTRP
jgi:hypothetical protein